MINFLSYLKIRFNLKEMIEITYIFHDCFVVETPELAIVFDFWKDPSSKHGDLPAFIKAIDKQKPLYVFVSHHHKDHYTKKIFEWACSGYNIKYILSKDVAKFARHILEERSTYNGPKPTHDQTIIIGEGETFMDDLIKVEAYGSTDIGNSYYIEINPSCKDKISLFHAGDLNAWIWKDESTEEEVEKALQDYKDILKKIVTNHKEIDYVMFPVDSRIGTDYFTGAKLFVREIDVKHFFPMHFELGESEEELRRRAADAAKVDLYANKERGEYICLQTPYSKFVKM